MANFSNPSPDSGNGGALPLVEVKPGVAREFLESFAPPSGAQQEGASFSWQARAALGIAIQILATREMPITEDVNFVDPDSAVGVQASNVFGEVRIELSHPRTGGSGAGNKLDLSGVPIFLLTDSEQTDGLVVHPAEFEGARANFPQIEDQYQVLLSPHHGSVDLRPATSVTNIIARGRSTDDVVLAQIRERQPGELQVSFKAKPQSHDPGDPGSITVEKGSVVFFAFVDRAGNKIDASAGHDDEMLGSQGSVQLDEELSGICSKIFKNIPEDARLVFMISPLL